MNYAGVRVRQFIIEGSKDFLTRVLSCNEAYPLSIGADIDIEWLGGWRL